MEALSVPINLHVQNRPDDKVPWKSSFFLGMVGEITAL